ncbi:hypothetical protein [Streptomyces sp. NPDC001876]|uniref:hypothetical protein n=1 Tax=Streptomyces sp. NPDC001876 TaxID=3154402 RepID=UPI00331B7AAF
MTTETTEPSAAAAAPDLTGWRHAQQLATNATWKASGATDVAPYCVTQIERNGAYIGDLHYAAPTPVRTIAAEYGVPVTEAPAAGTDVCVSARITVDGVEVRAWAYTHASPATIQTGGAA